MSLAVEKLLVPKTGYPARPAIGEAHQDLKIAVIFTSVESTLKALQAAGEMASSLGARINLVVPQVVAYTLPLESPPVLVQFSEDRFRAIAAQSGVETSVQIYLCRDRLETLISVLDSDSIVVLGGPKRKWPWWPSIWKTPSFCRTKEEHLAWRLRLTGFEVLFTETE